MKERERERYFRDDVIIDLDLFRAHSLCDAECYEKLARLKDFPVFFLPVPIFFTACIITITVRVYTYIIYNVRVITRALAADCRGRRLQLVARKIRALYTCRSGGGGAVAANLSLQHRKRVVYVYI